MKCRDGINSRLESELYSYDNMMKIRILTTYDSLLIIINWFDIMYDWINKLLNMMCGWINDLIESDVRLNKIVR